MTSTERHILLDLTDLLFRRFRRILVILGLSIGAALLYNGVTGPSYTASVRVLVSPSSGTIGGGPSSDGAVVVTDHGQTARNQAELLNDPGLVGKLLPATLAAEAPIPPGWRERLLHQAGERWHALAVRLGLISPASDKERFAARLGRAVSATAVGDTDVIRLDFTWGDRFFAAHTVNLLLKGYQQAIAASAAARDELRQAQLAQADAEAELTDADMHRAAQSGGRNNEAPADLDQERATLKERIEAARKTSDNLRLERELDRRKLDSVDQAYKTGGWVDSADAGDGAAKPSADFAALLQERQDLMAASKPDQRAIRRVNGEISDLRQENYLAVRRFESAQIDDISARLQRLDDQVTQDQADLRGLDGQAAQADVQNQARAARVARVAAARRRTEAASARVDAIWQEVGSTRALSEAAPPTEPDPPSPVMVLNAACLFGLVAGFGSALLAERRRMTIDRPSDIARHLKLDVVARLSEVPMAQLR